MQQQLLQGLPPPFYPHPKCPANASPWADGVHDMFPILHVFCWPLYWYNRGCSQPYIVQRSLQAGLSTAKELPPLPTIKKPTNAIRSTLDNHCADKCWNWLHILQIQHSLFKNTKTVEAELSCYSCPLIFINQYGEDLKVQLTKVPTVNDW